MDRDTAAVLISLAALIVSAVGAATAYRVGTRQNELQERLLNLETGRDRQRTLDASRARVSATIDRSARTPRLRLMNSGAEARDIVTRIDGQPVLKHDLIPRGTPEITRLGSGASAEYVLAVDMESPSKVFVELEWRDSSRRVGRWSSEVSLL